MTGIEGLFNRFIFNGYCQEYEKGEKLCFGCEFLQQTESWRKCRQISIKRKKSQDQKQDVAPCSYP